VKFRRASLAALALAATVALDLPWPDRAWGDGFTGLGSEPDNSSDPGLVEIGGALRVRTTGLYNLDLDHGLTPSGAPLFAVPTSNPDGQLLTHADMRLRTDLNFHAPTAHVAVRLRVDTLDNLAMGSRPAGPAATTLSQQPPDDAFRIRHAYGEARTALGLVAAGRMGSHWGMGIFTNGGDCASCNFGDSADRLAFVTSLLGHTWELAYEVSASGATGVRADGRDLDLDRDDDTRTARFSFSRVFGDAARDRRHQANVMAVEYGGYYAYRTQKNESLERPDGSTIAVPRGLDAHVLDGWLRVSRPGFEIEAEAVLVSGRIEQTSTIPGLLLPNPVTATQVGAAFRSQFGPRRGTWRAGLDGGFASGDSTPGFGAFPRPGAAPPAPGDLDGPQADGITDLDINNFRFHPDFHVDRILFREIIGAVTDAVYVRPHAHIATRKFAAGILTAELAAVTSFAVAAESTPGGEAALGVELDPTVRFESTDGFTIALEYGVLFPLAGLRNVATDQAASSAQLLQLRLEYAY
jgi:uncharacterized protein (TIGR04551 family)